MKHSVYFHMEASHSVCHIVSWIFLFTESILMLGDKLSPGTKPGFLKSEKMLRFKLLYIHKSVLENVYVNNIINYGWCYSITLAYNV